MKAIIYLTIAITIFLAGGRFNEAYPQYNFGEETYRGKQVIKHKGNTSITTPTDDISLDLVGRYPDGPCWVACQEGNIAYVASGSLLKVLDVSDLGNIQVLELVIMPSTAVQLHLSDHYLIVALHKLGMQILDVSDPANPFQTSVFNFWNEPDGGTTHDMAVDGNTAYLCGGYGVASFDISDPFDIKYNESIFDSTFVPRVAVNQGVVYFQSGYEYKGYSWGSEVWSAYLGSYDMGEGIEVYDGYVYYGRRNGMSAENLLTGETNTVNWPSYHATEDIIKGAGDYLLVGATLWMIPDSVEMHLIDISNPDQMLVIDDFTTFGYMFDNINNIGSTALMPAGQGGLKFVHYDAGGFSLLGEYDAGDRAQFITMIDNQHIFAANLYSLELFQNIFPLIFPVDDWYLFSYPKDIEVYNYPENPYLYISSSNGVGVTPSGLHIYNIADLNAPYEESFLGSIGKGDILVNSDNYLYTASSSSFYVIDISGSEPEIAGEEYLPSGISQMVAAPQNDYTLYVAMGQLNTIDVSSPSSPVLGDPFGPESTYKSLDAEGDYLYAGGYELVSVFNIANAPTFVSTFQLPGKGPVLVKAESDYVYAGTVWDGLITLDVSDPENISEVSADYTGGILNSVEIADHVYVMDEYSGIYAFGKEGSIGIRETSSQSGTVVLEQNFPNPFRTFTQINYSLSIKQEVEIGLYDQRGRSLKKMAKGYRNPGKYSISVDMSDFPAGTYYCRLKAGNEVQTRKLVLK